MTNAEIADALDELAVLYQLDGADRYRVLAYVNAARSIRKHGYPVVEMVHESTVTDLPGVGKTLAEKLQALVETGEIPAAVKLKQRIPAGLIKINRIPGLGPKTVRRLHEELGITTPEELREAAENQQIRKLSGMGAKSEEKILHGLDQLAAADTDSSLLRLDEIEPLAEALLKILRDHPACLRAEIAGEIRRQTDTAERIVLVAATEEAAELGAALAEHRTIAEHDAATADEAHLKTHSGIEITFRAAAPEAFGNLLQAETGSPAHNQKLGEVDRDFADESSLYRHRGYAYIPPELREDRGELEAAREDRLPELVAVDDIRGDLHSHTTLSDGAATLEEMAAAAKARGYEYLAITDHSASHGFGDHVTADRLWRRIEEIEAFNATDPGIRLLAGTEVNILPDGELDYDDDLLAALDWVIASIHTSFGKPEAEMTARMIAAIEHPEVDCIGHATGRLIGSRRGYEIDLEACFAAAAAAGTAFEINGNPRRRDLDEVQARLASEVGVGIVLNTDAHQPESLAFIRYAVATARRAWLGPGQILNTRSWWK